MLRQLGGVGLLFVPEGRLMAVDPLLERTFGQPEVLLLITLRADCCLVDEVRPSRRAIDHA